jgi:hypothetical protein
MDSPELNLYSFVWKDFKQVLALEKAIEKHGGRMVRCGSLFIEYVSTKQLH